MASSSGNSNGTASGNQKKVADLKTSSSEENLQAAVVEVVDDRKRKRMQSNRESARRSRMRKQKHLDEMMSQVSELKRQNVEILDKMNLTTQQFLTVEAENSVLRARMAELSSRLDSLNEMIRFMSPAATGGDGFGAEGMQIGAAAAVDDDDVWMSSLNYHQPIMMEATDYHHHHVFGY